MYTLRATTRFQKTAARFFAHHPDLEARFVLVAELLRQDPFHPALKLHPLKGTHAGLHSVRLTYSYRVTLVLVVTQKTVTLIDIGSHNDVY